MIRLKKIAILATLAFALLAAADFALADYFFDIAIPRVHHAPPMATDQATEWLAAQPLQTERIAAPDGTSLAGYYLPASPPTTLTAILVHGYREDGRHSMRRIARMYHDDLHANVLIVDNRAHGQSGGRYIGFGGPDRLDVIAWVGFILRQHPDSRIVLHGVSMGAAAVLMATGESLPPNVIAVVSDCAYSDLPAQLGARLRAQYHLPPALVLPAANLITRLRAGYWLTEVQPAHAVRRSRTPTLFIHGGDDRYVDVSMVHALFAAEAAPKALLIVPGAGHAGSYHADPELYQRTIRDFLARWQRYASPP